MATVTPAQRPANTEPPSAGALAEQRHQYLDLDADTAFARLAAEHGDKVSTAADYPDWTCPTQP